MGCRELFLCAHTLAATVMTGKFKYLRKPLLLAAVLVWMGYIFTAKSVSEGVMTVVLLVLMVLAVNV